MPTKIEWCDESWNPCTGCSPVSPGCRECWAKKMAKRLRGRFGYPQDEPFRVTFRPDRLDQPKCWRKPRRIFVCSMSDMWHKDVTPAERRQIVLAAMAAPQHTYLFLTKRIVTAMNEIDFLAFPNFWLGTSVENQPTHDERFDYLMECKAALWWLSAEPLLGPIVLPSLGFTGPQTMVDWIVIGAESIGSRPGRECRIEWIESLVDQARVAGIPCLVKQIHLDGKLVKDVTKFPKHLQVQEYPT